MRKIPLVAATLVALPGLSLAWSSSSGPGQGFEGPAPYAYPAPYGPYADPSYGAMGPGYGGAFPQAPMSSPLASWPRLDIARKMEEDAYIVDIALQNIDPNQVEIRPSRSGLLIHYSTERRLDRENQLPDGGYSSRYSVSRGTASRRVGLPGDADLAAMTTEIKDGGIQVRIPRSSTQRGAWPPPSARP